MYLIAPIVVFIIAGVFAVQNPGAQDFSLLGYSWRLPLWVPTAIGVGLVTVLLVLQMSTSGLGHRFRQLGHFREIDQHRGLISELRDENARLREELAARRGELSALRSGQTVVDNPRPTWRDSLRAWGQRVAHR